MAINGSGIRDTARVVKISQNTVIAMVKKASSVLTVNPNFLVSAPQNVPTVRLERVCDESELDENGRMWVRN